MLDGLHNQHPSVLTYFLNLYDALKTHMHSKHKLGHANPSAGYYSYYKGLLLLAHKNISNAFWTMFNLPFKMKKTFSTTAQVPFSIKSMPRPVFYAPSVITQTVPYTFYQVVNSRLFLV